MPHYAQFCPVAKAAEIFADRWTPLIVQELCFGQQPTQKTFRFSPESAPALEALKGSAATAQIAAVV